jgi:hypothetical protein
VFGPNVEALTFTRISAETFGTFTLDNKGEFGCPTAFRGTHALRGTYVCKDAEIRTEKLEQVLGCEGTLHLSVGGEPVGFTYTQALSLAEPHVGSPFSVFESF